MFRRKQHEPARRFHASDAFSNGTDARFQNDGCAVVEPPFQLIRVVPFRQRQMVGHLGRTQQQRVHPRFIAHKRRIDKHDATPMPTPLQRALHRHGKQDALMNNRWHGHRRPAPPFRRRDIPSHFARIRLQPVQRKYNDFRSARQRHITIKVESLIRLRPAPREQQRPPFH